MISAALKYNGLLGDPIFSAESATEPVTTAEFKEHHNITHTDDDVYIGKLIKRCRAAMEKYTGVGLISRTITLRLYNMKGNIPLPYGPVTTFTSMADKEGTAVVSDNYKLYPASTGWVYVESPVSEYLTVVYVAGYTNATIPEDLKDDLLAFMSWRYEHRGDELEQAVRNFGAKHRRMTWFL